MSRDYSSVMEMALAASKKGKKEFDKHASAVPVVCGGTVKEWLAHWEIARQAAQRDASVKTIEARCAAYPVPKKLLAILQAAHEHCDEFKVAEVKDGDKVVTPAFLPRLAFTMTFVPEEGDKAAHGIVKVTSGKVTTRASKGGTKGENSRISAFTAWKTGKKRGDTFVVTQEKNSEKKVCGYKVYASKDDTTGRYVVKGKLTEYFLAQYPKSETIAYMRTYPALKIPSA